MNLNLEQRTKIFDKVSRLVETKHFNPTMNGVDWKALAKDRREQILACEEPEAFEKEVNRLVAELKTSHTGFRHAGARNIPARHAINATLHRLIEFIESKRTLDDIYGQEKVKSWLRQDIALWKSNDVQALPKGYLLCGPVGTGKTFMVECLAGEADVPIVKLKNFRDKWVGSTEGNLEKIFRLLQALGRCYVFIDEADQAIGRRESASGDSGISGRIYSMLAEEMGSSSNRGKLIWILASSRPDLIEVDLKRPGRIDVKIPLFPTTDTRESFELIRVLCARRQLTLGEDDYNAVAEALPVLLTPGSAETLAVKIYRISRTENKSPAEALRASLTDYQNPVPLDALQFQIQLAVKESTDLEFIPNSFRSSR